MIYAIEIGAATKLQLQLMAEPFFGVQDCGPLCRAAQDLLRATHPDRQIVVFHVRHDPDLLQGRIRLGVEVDGALDQGLIFTKPPSNDNGERVALAA